MDDIRVRRGRDGGLRVRVGSGEPVRAEAAHLRRLVGRTTRARVRLAEPGLVFDEGVRALLHDPPPSLAEVCVGGEVFALERRFDAAALALLVLTCARVASDPGTGWAGGPVPDFLSAALQVQSIGTSSRRPVTRPERKAARNAAATSPDLPSG